MVYRCRLSAYCSMILLCYYYAIIMLLLCYYYDFIKFLYSHYTTFIMFVSKPHRNHTIPTPIASAWHKLSVKSSTKITVPKRMIYTIPPFIWLCLFNRKLIKKSPFYCKGHNYVVSLRAFYAIIVYRNKQNNINLIHHLSLWLKFIRLMKSRTSPS